MTGIEKLRTLSATLGMVQPFKLEGINVVGKTVYEWLADVADQIEREIDEAVADEVADTLSAYEMNTNARWHSAVEEGAESDCKAEYEMISRYWLPRPRFEDGEAVQWGDEFVSSRTQATVDEITLTASGTWKVEGKERTCWVIGQNGARLSRPEPPDSWERVEADVDKNTCEYFGRVPHDDDCDGCPGEHHVACMEVKMLDLVRRCKALAGVE